MPKLPSTGEYSRKWYKCKSCRVNMLIATNHWGDINNYYCWGCRKHQTWECDEPVPIGYRKRLIDNG